ncbi:MAG: DUF1579 family protein [Beijerinckiaceae bacterium]
MSTDHHPTAAHNKLQAFVGNWRGEETMSGEPWGEPGAAQGYIGASLDLDGFFVMLEYRQVRASGVTFKARAIFGYDTAQQLYNLYWFDSLGFAPPAPATGYFKGNVLALTRPSLRGTARHSYTFLDADRMQLDVDYSADQGATWSSVVTGIYRRNMSTLTETGFRS